MKNRIIGVGEGKRKYHQYMYLFALALLVGSISLSRYLLSIAQIILMLNWIAEGQFSKKTTILKKQQSIIWFASIYLIYLAGTLYTNDFGNALHSLKLKLPILILPVIIGTSRKLKYWQVKTILLIFVAGIFVNSLISTMVLTNIIPKNINDIRDISIFISHIPFSSMVALSLFILVYYALFDKKTVGKTEKTLYAFLSLWFSVYIFLLQSLTGIVTFIAFIILFIYIQHVYYKNRVFSWLGWITIILVTCVLGYLFAKAYTTFHPDKPIHEVERAKFTPNGNPYYHALNSEEAENGHYVWLHVNQKELKKEWNEISDIPYKGADKMGQPLRLTLIRYLTSRGYTKDSLGISKLTEKDIQAIESGHANYIFTKKYSLYPRIYKIVWQIDWYTRTGNPAGQSLTKRAEALKVGVKIIQDHFFIGMGTGDIESVYTEYYQKTGSKLPKEEYIIGHNQFVNIWISFGLLGLIWFCTAFFYPVKLEKGLKSYLFLTFLAAVLVLMLSSNAIRFQIGTTYIAFFYSFILFQAKEYFILSRPSNK